MTGKEVGGGPGFDLPLCLVVVAHEGAKGEPGNLEQVRTAEEEEEDEKEERRRRR